jgi:hypothetical protein
LKNCRQKSQLLWCWMHRDERFLCVQYQWIWFYMNNISHALLMLDIGTSAVSAVQQICILKITRFFHAVVNAVILWWSVNFFMYVPVLQWSAHYFWTVFLTWYVSSSSSSSSSCLVGAKVYCCEHKHCDSSVMPLYSVLDRLVHTGLSTLTI